MYGIKKNTAAKENIQIINNIFRKLNRNCTTEDPQ